MTSSRPGAPATQRWEACCFDWDGTAVPTRQSDARALRDLLSACSAAAIHCAIVTGTSFEIVDRQLQLRPPGPGTLLVATNRGSELFLVTDTDVISIAARVATPEENAALDRAAHATITSLRKLGLPCELVASRRNRRKIDLIPEPKWADPPKAQLPVLLAAVEARCANSAVHNLRTAVTIAAEAARTAGCCDPRITSDAKHIEIGLTDKGDSAHAIARYWWDLGIGPEGMLVVGDEFGSLGGVPGSDARLILPGVMTISVGPEPEGIPPGVFHCPGGPTRFDEIMRAQLEARRHGALPNCPNHAWTLHFRPHDTETVRRTEALTTLTDGTIGVRGIALQGARSDIPAVYVNNLYTATGPETTLLAAPEPQSIATNGVYSETILDLHTAVLYEQRPNREVLGVRFLAEPGELYLRTRATVAGDARVGSTGEPSLRRAGSQRSATGDAGTVTATDNSYIHEQEPPVADLRITYTVDTQAETAGRLTDAPLRATDFDLALDWHRRRLSVQWEHATVDISGDVDLERAVRFATFHLLHAAPERGIGALGARGLTGPAYRGHVFWDADVFVLPFLAATQPARARAVLEYRIAHLDEALTRAKQNGFCGAQFPWECAGSGTDVTPETVQSRTGARIPIRTGALEIHIVADVAWAIHEYLAWTNDTAFRYGEGARCLVEIARFWTSRIRVDGRGRAHIFGVIGPDEYHEPVDDNAFTNVMARNALRWAAAIAEEVNEMQPDLATFDEIEKWRQLANQLVDGYDAASGLYEQCSGFFALEPLIIAEVAPRRPIAADLLLGRTRLLHAQVLKQADVLMLYALVPHDVVADSLLPNLLFYEPRTAHGSSLSLGIHALLYARCGQSQRALELLRLAASIDLDDITQTTALGLHLGAMGSVWLACVWGLLGCRAEADALQVDPRVPAALGCVSARVTFRGVAVRCSATSETLELTTDAAIDVRVGTATDCVGPGRTTWLARNGGWERI